MRAPAAAAVSLGVALILGGCATSAQSRFDPTAAGDLQSTVLAISEAAHDGAFGEAAGQLDELEASAIAAFSRGEMSRSRFDAIMVAIELVRADLSAEIEAAQEPSAEPVQPTAPAEPTDGSGSSGSSGSGSGGGATSEPEPQPEPEPEPEPTKDSNGRGNPGVPGPPDDKGKPKD